VLGIITAILCHLGINWGKGINIFSTFIIADIIGVLMFASKKPKASKEVKEEGEDLDIPKHLDFLLVLVNKMVGLFLYFRVFFLRYLMIWHVFWLLLLAFCHLCIS